MPEPIDINARRRERAQRRVQRGGRPEGIPDDWPITFLGSWGEYDFWLDSIGLLKWLRTDRLNNRAVIYRLVGSHWQWLEQNYAKREQLPDGTWVIKPDTLSLSRLHKHLAHMLESAGAFDPRWQVRGLGAWLHDDGKHVWVACNYGDGIGFYSGDRSFTGQPQLRDGWVYPRQAKKLTRPEDEGLSLTGWPADSFAPWRFQHPLLAPKLLAGAVTLAPVGALLPVRPVIGIGGIDGYGRGALLTHIGRLLGPWLRHVPGNTDAAIRDALEMDRLAVMLNTEPARLGRERSTRRPDFESSILKIGQLDVMRFGAAEVVANPDLAPHTLTLRLAEGWPASLVPTDRDCAARLPTLLRQVTRRFGWIDGELIPAWGRLLRDIDGAETDAGRTVATLLSGWWAGFADRLPTQDDLAEFADELDAFMLTEFEQRVPAHVLALRFLLDSMAPERGYTIRHSLAIEAGYDNDDGGLAVAGGVEYRAIKWATVSETAIKARAINSSLGLRIVGSEPGYREIAIAVGVVPMRERIERMAGFPPSAIGSGFAELMMALPGARRSTHTIRFDSIGRHRAVLIPLYAQLEDAGDE